jgi:lipid-A-disaccharide synthase-like uncharacterized protein
MPPRSPAEIAKRRIHNLIGLFAVSVFFFFITWLAGSGSTDRGAPLLLWLFGLLAALSLGGWIFLSSRQVEQTSSLVDKLLK